MTDIPADAPQPATPPAETRRRALLRWLPLVLGVVLAFTFLEWARTHVLILLDRAAFGRDTAVYSGGKRDRVDVTQCAGAGDSQRCVDSWVRAGKPPVILWFGNSQLMGINRSKPGDVNAPGQLHDLVAPRGYRLVTYAQPNVNLTEEEITFNAVAPIYKPRLFIFPVCYDDLRELQVRDQIAGFLTGGKAPAADDDADEAKPAEPGKVATNQTVQARFEDAVTNELEANWPLWKSRIHLRGTTGFAIHTLRNKVLGIHSTSKRPVDPGLYRSRMQLLEKIVANARAQGVDVLLYVPPYRQDIDGPYVRADYERFKQDMQAIAARHGARYADLTPLVPGPEWATVTDNLFGFKEPDFMHFTVVGHTRLAQALDQQIRAMGY
jgi:hypothetical protein